MKINSAIVLLCCGFAPVVLSSCCCFRCLGGSQQGGFVSRPVALGELINEVQQALDNVSSNPIPGLPPLQSAEVSVTTEQGKTVSGEVALVLSASYSRARTNGQVLSFTLEPRRTTGLVGSAGNRLAESIRAAMNEVQKSNLGKLKVGEVSAEATVEVVNEASGGVSFEFSGASISAEGSAEYSRSSLHSIKLIFK